MVLLTNCKFTDMLLSEIVSIVFFVTRLLALLYLITYEKAIGYLLVFTTNPDNPTVIYIILGIYLFIDILLLFGSHKKIWCFMVLWQFAALIWVFISILEIFYHETFRDFILGLFSITITGWACLTIYRALQEINEEEMRNIQDLEN